MEAIVGHDGLGGPLPPPKRTRPLRRVTRGFTASVSAGLLVIVLTLIAIGLILDHNLRAIDRLVDQVITIEEPTKTAAHEMEINVLGTGLGVWKYLATGAAEHRERVKKDERDFRRFRAEYDRLTSTTIERELGQRIDALYERYFLVGNALMDRRDESVARLAVVTEAIDEIDRILDEGIQPKIESDSPDGTTRLFAANAIEADVAEIGTWIGLYIADPTVRHQERITESVQEARAQLAAFLELQLTPEERVYAARLQRMLDPTIPQIEQAVESHDALLRDQAAFIELRNQLDDLLDEGIQVLAGSDLKTAQPKANAAIHRLYGASLVVLALGAIVCVGAASLITYRSVQLHSANQELRQEIVRRQESEAARAQLLSELVSAQEKERGRLARELHDQMGQHLSTIMLGLKCLARHPARESPAPPGQLELQQLQELTGQMIQQVHTIAWELRPAALDELGLHGALSNYVEDWAQRSGVKVDFESDLEGQRLPGTIEIALYRVAQEALTNVMKHAEARAVSLTLQRRGPEVVMVVEDDGRGFVPEQVLPSSAAKDRLGVLGMKERAHLVGGMFEVESAPGRGTTLVVRISVT